MKIFSNCREEELKMNGQSLGSTKPNDVNVFRWENVLLKPGANVIEAVGHSATTSPVDQCQWTLRPSGAASFEAR